MKMIQGAGSIANYESYARNYTEGEYPYKVPVNSLSDVQLYIDIGASAPGSATYELIHTCGAIGTVESIVPADYVVGQDTNENYYGVFRNFSGSSANCFVIAITLGSDIYFSDEYEISCYDLTLIQGCYGNLDPLLSYDCEGVYFGESQGGTLGDATVVYKHQLLIESVSVKLTAIKNTFKQGRTRTFRTEKEKLYEFLAEWVPEWYLLAGVDPVFTRGEVFIDSVKWLVSDTPYELIDECKRTWKPTVTLKESCYQSFSCELDPCADPVAVCCDVTGVSAIAGESFPGGQSELTVTFGACAPAPANGYNVQYRIKGSGDPYNDAGNFSSSPAVFIDIDTNPIGTEYEGFVRSDCGDGLFGASAAWSTDFEESGSGDSTSCGTMISQETVEPQYKDLGFYILNIGNAIHVDLRWFSYERPNRFTLYDNGNILENTGWKGEAAYPALWGPSLSTAQSGIIGFNPIPGHEYKLQVEVGPADYSNPITDNFDVFIDCTFE